MDEYLRKIKGKKTHVHYLGKDIQNKLIKLLSNESVYLSIKNLRGQGWDNGNNIKRKGNGVKWKIQSVEEQFTLMQKISLVFGFLYGVYSLQSKTWEEIMEHCLNLEQALQHEDSKDRDTVDLSSELQATARYFTRMYSVLYWKTI